MMALFPKNYDFFRLFDAQVDQLRAAMAVARALGQGSDLRAGTEQLREIEHAADEVTHTIFRTLHQTFITPIEREDIAALAKGLDDILDALEESLNRARLYHLAALPAPARHHLNLIEKAIGVVAEATGELRQPKKRMEVLKHCEMINFIENQVDDLNRQTLEDLFEHTSDPIEIIKLKDLYEALERVADRCERVANILETIVVKNL